MKSLDRPFSAPPSLSETTDPLTLHSLLDGLDHVGLDRRGTFQALEVTLWSHHEGMSTGTGATLVGARPGNVLVVLSDFALNQGEQLALHRALQLEGPSPRVPCHVLSSRPGMRAGDARRTYVLELQRARAA
ncbi:MAG: hypothetical protein KGM87_07280 [Betaproteobacteria bacterium]|nr:hypothetical protein [Betaproteobacteria bacterium]